MLVSEMDKFWDHPRQKDVSFMVMWPWKSANSVVFGNKIIIPEMVKAKVKLTKFWDHQWKNTLTLMENDEKKLEWNRQHFGIVKLKKNIFENNFIFGAACFWQVSISVVLLVAFTWSNPGVHGHLIFLQFVTEVVLLS